MQYFFTEEKIHIKNQKEFTHDPASNFLTCPKEEENKESEKRIFRKNRKRGDIVIKSYYEYTQQYKIENTTYNWNNKWRNDKWNNL